MAGKKEAKKYKAPGLLSSLLALPTENLPQNSGGLLTQYTPSLREKIGNAIYDKARSVGLLNAQNMRVNAQSAVDFVPGVGDAVGFNEAGRDIQAGNYGAGIAGLGLAGVGLIPGAGDMAQKLGKKALANAPEGIRAFHGSPHSFDKFSLDKIGTGEGAQSYGHGLYFAENEDVAKGYREALKYQSVFKDGIPNDGPTRAAMAVDALGDEKKAIDSFQSRLSNFSNDKNHPSYIGALDALRAIEDGSYKKANLPSGSMYEVNIRANPDDFLDWDKPLSEQPVKAQETFRGLLGKAQKSFPSVDPSADMTVKNAHNVYAQHRGGNADAVAEELRQAGIPGIKYLDAGSRAAGDGSRNYVVFDDKLIDIVRKYGIAGAIGAGLITHEMGQQMQDQGLL